MKSFIAVNRHRYRLSLYRRRRLTNKWARARHYEIAIGKVGYSTPAGLYTVERKAENPSWLVPNEEWADPELRGKIIPGGHPDNPLIGVFIQVYQGVGIHGTSDLASLGQAASHGCIRMRPEEARDIYRLTPIGTPVYIT